MVTFRPAHESDLVQAHEVFYANEVRNQPDPPPALTTPSTTLAHIQHTGTVYVAEEQGRILAFAGAITRDEVSFLTDLFVLPDQQSSHLGQRLLQHVLPATTSGIRCTMSSSDPRALALYIRSGMRPQWPHFSLLLEDATRAKIPTAGLEIVEADADDPGLLAWDAQAGGRQRPQDHAYWTGEQRAVPLWFRRAGKTVGYGYARLGAGVLWYPAACSLGPIGASTPDEATACVLAAMDWARHRAHTLHIEVPGPHPCLRPLLEARFHIQYADTYLASSQTPFFDPTCYVASGSDLF